MNLTLKMFFILNLGKAIQQQYIYSFKIIYQFLDDLNIFGNTPSLIGMENI